MIISKHPLEQISIDRTSNSSLKICWSFADKSLPVSIYRADSANCPQRTLVAENIEGTEFNYPGKIPPTAFFFLLAGDAPGVWVGERLVQMEGTVNFRDLGGYRSTNGKQVKWGLIFRGDSLQRATDKDLEIVKQLKIGEIFDFRRVEEVEKGPDRLPPDHDLSYNHVPVVHGEFNFMAAIERLKQNSSDIIEKETIIKGYLDNTVNFATTWGRVISRLADKDCPPLYFHCTAGKDRTGICAALILSALEVPRETIMEDYLLSNPYIEVVWKRVQKMIEDQGIDPEKLSPFFSAPSYALDAMLDHLDRAYHGVMNFLHQIAEVEQATIESLQLRLLE